MESNNLGKDDVERYSRHLILPEIGVKGQRMLLASKVLIIGAGGLSSSCALYLAGAGVGQIGIVDHDTVERSNLHRQIIHSDNACTNNMNKAESARESILRLNPTIKCIAYPVLFSSENARQILSEYDVVIDCSDNPPTRYLVNDACVLFQKPLVSGSSIMMEGQMSVYNYNNGPCYRCVHPKPPPQKRLGNCSNNGVLGVVPGIIGSLQALEVIKIFTESQDVFSNKILLFDAATLQFRNINIQKNKNCELCSENPKITELVDYYEFCGSKPTDSIGMGIDYLDESYCISPVEFHSIVETSSTDDYLIIDVRSQQQYSICSLKNSINIPLKELASKLETLKLEYQKYFTENSIYLICRRGNDSQKGAEILINNGVHPKHITGGLLAWSKQVDSEFPIY
jgi:adenylyltransferase/sulfurtransferase